MAVVKKNRPVEEFKKTLTLSDGMEINCTLRKNAFTVGEEEALAISIDEVTVLQERAAFLKKQAIEATDEREHQTWMKKYQSFGEKLNKIYESVDFTITKIVAAWDLALSEDDEKAGRYVPLTKDGLNQLNRALRWDVFSAVTDAVREIGEAEKKGLFENSNGDMLTLKGNSAHTLDSSPATASPCDTVSDPNPSSVGMSTSTMKPS